MAVFGFLKQRKSGELPEGEYPFNVIAIDAETQEEFDAKKADYLANGYEESSKEEYETETGAVVNEDGSITPAAEQPVEDDVIPEVPGDSASADEPTEGVEAAQ